jgi:hypothetical protein
MDETQDGFAYRCIPLSIANAHGWEIRCTTGFEAVWNGGTRPEDVQIRPDDAAANGVVVGNFGSGILTFQSNAVFRTSAGYDLWVSGPTNAFKDGIQALSAVVETDWSPYSFSMNWKFTRPGLSIRFEKGEPYCFIFPVERGLIERVEPELRLITSDPELERQHAIASRRRKFPLVLKRLQPDYEPDNRTRFQGWYARGVLPDGSERGTTPRTRLHVKSFERHIGDVEPN